MSSDRQTKRSESTAVIPNILMGSKICAKPVSRETSLPQILLPSESSLTGVFTSLVILPEFSYR